MPKKRATQDDVAAMAGVTRATVSYVLNGRGESLKITPEVIQRVETAAKKLRYLPNLAARSLAAGKSHQIGLVTPGPEFVKNYYWGPILSGVEKAALRRDYDILLLSAEGDSPRKMKNYLLQNRIDVAIAIGSGLELVRKRFPVPPVIVGARLSEQKIPSVVTTVEIAVGELVEKMRENGVTEMVWVGPNLEPSSNRASADRVRWMEYFCREVAMPFRHCILSFPQGKVDSLPISDQIAHWEGQLAALPFTPARGMGFFCWNDLVALGLYRILARAELQIGRDVAVAGVDNFFAEAAYPPLASIGFNSEKLGEAAVQTAIEVFEQSRSDGRKIGAPLVEVPARLILRESLGLRRD